ncbi:MAG TPA: hypothetical protein VK559_07785 [Ferruginibacter sp.]|nr:hypothetical protein [Ferruginibacter sp.]
MKNFTTKMILSAAIVFGSLTAVSAQSYDNNNVGYDQPQTAYQDQYTQPNQPAQQQYSNQPQGYYYYPDANVYYNPVCDNYIYNNGAAWLTVNVLPWNIRIGGLPRFMVYHRGPQVWLDNNIHRGYYAHNYGFRSQPAVAYRNYGRGGYDRGFARGGYYGGGNRGGFGHGRR